MLAALPACSPSLSPPARFLLLVVMLAPVAVLHLEPPIYGPLDVSAGHEGVFTPHALSECIHPPLLQVVVLHFAPMYFSLSRDVESVRYEACGEMCDEHLAANL
jgi:hypothetical protein